MRDELKNNPGLATVEDCRDKAFVKHVIDKIIFGAFDLEDSRLAIVDVIVDAHFEPDRWAASYWQGRSVSDICWAKDCPEVPSLSDRNPYNLLAPAAMNVPVADVLDYLSALLRSTKDMGQGEEVLESDIHFRQPYLVVRAMIDLTVSAPEAEADRQAA